MNPPKFDRWRRSRRRGFTLFEIFVAVAVFGSVLATFVPLMQSVHKQQRAADQQLLALREADNLLEEISQQSWQALIPDELAKRTLSETAKAHLLKSELRVTVDEQAGPPVAKRVSVEVSWTPHAGQPTKSVRLVAWFSATDGKPTTEGQP